MSQLDTFRGFDVHTHPKRAEMIKQHHRLATALVGGLALLTLAACGSNSASGGTNPPAGNASGAPGGGQTGRGGAGQGAGGGFPGVSGLIVALSGKTIAGTHDSRAVCGLVHRQDHGDRAAEGHRHPT